MRVGVVLADVVPVAGDGLVRSEALEPVVDVLDQTGLSVVDVHGGGDVHRVDEHEPVLDSGGPHERVDTIGDVEVVPPMRRLEGEVLGCVLHARAILPARWRSRGAHGPTAVRRRWSPTTTRSGALRSTTT